MTPIRIAYAKVAPGAAQAMYAANSYFDGCSIPQLLRRLVELRVSSNETNIAPRSVRIAFGASDRSATVCMVVSRVSGRNLTLPERWSLSTSPWDLDCLANIFLVVRCQMEASENGVHLSDARYRD